MFKLKLNKALQKELKARKITISAIAKECKISVSVLYSWVNGRLTSAKDLHHIKTLTSYLVLSADQLFFGTSTNSRHTLFFNTFIDRKTQYQLIIEKVEDK